VRAEAPLGRSDHAVLLFQDGHAPAPRAPPTRRKLYLKADKNNLQDVAQRLEWSHVDPDDLEGKWDLIRSNILWLEETQIPSKVITSSTKPRWFKPRVSRDLRARNRAFQEYTEFPTRASFHNYLRERDRADRIKTLAREAFEERLAGVLTKNNTTPFFSYAKPKNTEFSNYRLMGDSRETTTSPEQWAGIFRNYFPSVFAQDDHRPLKRLPAITEPRMDWLNISPDNVLKLLSTIRPNSAPGPDGIHPAMLRLLAPVLAARSRGCLTHLCVQEKFLRFGDRQPSGRFLRREIPRTLVTTHPLV